MEIKGTISDWESWTDMKFPETGKYTIPGALCPVKMDLRKNSGIYLEPNIWVLHKTNT